MSTTTLTQNDLEKPPVDIELSSDTDKKELVTADAMSITSGTTLASSAVAFTPVKSLHINAKGIPVLRLPFPSSELQIDIYNNAGSLAYQSTRPFRSKGSCVLTNAEGKQLIATDYFSGPCDDPVLRILDGLAGNQSHLKTASRWTSRKHDFALPDGRTFTWEYKRERGFGGEGKNGTALVLTLQGRRIAALIRNNETRTPGSKSCSAGNGGELVLGADVGGKEGIDEELVVASCILMLKKEIDRRRTGQALMIAAAVS